MTSLPYMPLFVNDYLADTAHLTAQEHGAYLLLIMNYWQRQGPLPADDKRLSAIARLTLNQWLEIRPTIEEMFQPQSDGNANAMRWHHARIDYELQISEAKKTKARASANARWNKHKNAVALQTQSERNAPTQPNPTQEVNANAFTTRANDYPIDAFEQWFEKYPHKVGIQAARKEFGFIRSYGKVSFKTLLDGVERYVASKPPDREWCNPARWLKEGRWDDVPGPPVKKGNGKIGFGETAEMMINDLRAKERTIAEIGGDADEQFALSAPKRL